MPTKHDDSATSEMPVVVAAMLLSTGRWRQALAEDSEKASLTPIRREPVDDRIRPQTKDSH